MEKQVDKERGRRRVRWRKTKTNGVKKKKNEEKKVGVKGKVRRSG